jgi:MFS family permease
VASNTRTVLRERATWLVGIVLFAGTGVNITVFGLWGVPYVVQTYGTSVPTASNFTLLGSLGLVVGPPVMGWLSDRLDRRTGLVVVGMALYALTFAVLAVTGDPPIAVVGIVFFLSGFLAGAYALGYTVVKERHESGASGVSTGTVNTIGFAGAAVLPTLMGFVLDAYRTGRTLNGAQVYSVLGYRVAFGLAAVTGALAVVAALLLHRDA